MWVGQCVINMGVKSISAWELSLRLAFLASLIIGGHAQGGYFGTSMGRLEPLQHQVKGDVFAVDSRTVHIKGFSYDGLAPDAFFYAGTTPTPGNSGFIIPDENGSVEPLGAYRNKDVTITLPEGKTLKDIKWISVWCRAYSIDFGHMMISNSLEYPRPQKIEALPTFQHGLSSDRVVVVDAQTFLIPNFHYDGQAPDAYFWVGKGSRPDTQGIIVPDENGSEEPLKKYSGKTIVITLPDDLTVFDIDYLGVWCRAFTANFGHIRMPRSLNVPPSLKMLGVAPQTKLNCEVLWDDMALEVRWAVAGESIVMQLVGRISDGQYMSFGTSGSLTRSVMVGGDVVVAWLDQASGRGDAQDYHLGAKAQCQGGRGSCPDDQIQGSRNNVRLLNAALINDFTMLTFQRPLAAADPSDVPILTNGSQAVIWAVGPVNSQGHTSYHSLRLRGDMFVDFGRTPEWNCPVPEDNQAGGQAKTGHSKPPPAPKTGNAWYIPPIPCNEPEDGVMYAQIGPTGGDSGYSSITGHVGWGIAWYINGLLIPEIYVVRGKTYTFVVEGGNNPDRPERDHPFYITDDPEGGYSFKTPAERARVRVFAGVSQDREGNAVPTGLGRLCEWEADPSQLSSAFSSFGAYQRTLQLKCEEGQEPGVLQWTPDASTPDTVYYQCFTHRYLGWKIHVLDSCDLDGLSASAPQPVVIPSSAPSDYDYYDDYYDDGPKNNFGLATRFHSNKISSEMGSRAPSKRPFPLPPDSSEYQADFDNFPFHLGPTATGPSIPNRPPSPQDIPLGAPGFTFPKLPNIRSATGFVNVSAFDSLGNSGVSGSYDNGDNGNGGNGDEFFEGHLHNIYPPSPSSSFTTSSHRNKTPTKPTPISSPSSSSISLKSASTTFPSPSASSTTSLSSTHQHISSTPTWTDTSRHSTHSTSSSTYSTGHSTHTPHANTASTSFSSSSSSSSYPTTTTTAYNTDSTYIPSKYTTFPTNHTSSASKTAQPSLPPLSRTSPNSPHHQTTSQSPKATPTRTTSLPRTHFPHTISSSSRTSTSPHLVTRYSHHQHDVNTTAPTQSPQPHNSHSHKHTKPPRRNPQPHMKATPSLPSTRVSDSFVHSFGFDPDSVVYESDFRPIKQQSSGPVLAFEVSPSSTRPLNAPKPPRPPLQHYYPGGPRTTDHFRFKHRRIKLETEESWGEEEEDIDEAPAVQNTANHNHKHIPMPLAMPMAPVLPLLGGAASNMPLKPARTTKPSRPHPSPNPHPHYKPWSAGALTGPQGSVDRLGWPQPPARRLVASLIPLPEDHLVPVPQLLGPTVLTPVFPDPPPHPSPGPEWDHHPAASAHVFTSDGHPLPLDTIPDPPSLATPHHVSATAITAWPQVAPYRGEWPPPVPSRVPQLPQFSKQRRPSGRRTTMALPPLHDVPPQPPHSHTFAGSAPALVVVPPPSSPAPGHTEAPPTSQPGNSDTRLAILKDVWATLTQDHPREDAHPAHDPTHHHPSAPLQHTIQHLDGIQREPRHSIGEGE